MRKWLCLGLLFSACGGTVQAEWAGDWKSAPAVPGSYVTMTLSGSGTAVSGNGIQYREAGSPVNFTVSGNLGGTPAGMVTFTFADSSTEGFNYSQADNDHLTLTNANRTLAFTRQ
jgi:hypothetical protein